MSADPLTRMEARAVRVAAERASMTVPFGERDSYNVGLRKLRALEAGIAEPDGHRLKHVYVTHWKDTMPVGLRIRCSCGWETDCGYREEDAAHAAHVVEVTDATDPA